MIERTHITLLTRGGRSVIRAPSSACLLLGLCVAPPSLAGEPTPSPPATTTQVHQAVDRAITYLQTESAAWLSTRKCAACHHAPMPLWALAEAERQAITLGARNAKLSTFEWQARGFYLKQGYEEYARIDDYAPGFYLAYMKKALQAP